MVPIWFNDIQILFDKAYICEFYPTSDMDINSKLNAISRLVIVLSLVGWLLFKNANYLFLGLFGLIVIFCVYKLRKAKDLHVKFAEGFENENVPVVVANAPDTTLKSILKTSYRTPSKKNPFGNRLLTDSNTEPSAPPAFNPNVSQEITKQVKKSIQSMNPELQTSKQLFGDLYDQFQLDQSNRQFYSTADTYGSRGGDQSSFAKYCYGDMPSCRGNLPGDPEKCVNDNGRYILM